MHGLPEDFRCYLFDMVGLEMSDEKKNTLYCSFCGKSQHDVRKLIAGPGVFICDDCTMLCAEIVLEESDAQDYRQRLLKACEPKAQLGSGDTVATQGAPSASNKTNSDTAPLIRKTTEYWLHRMEEVRCLPHGDSPLIMMSYASEDRRWVNDLKAFVAPKLEGLIDENGQNYEMWNFEDERRGTAPGDEFPDIVAEKMWRCRVAIILLSRDYFSSSYCREIELPFLFWRRDHHSLLCVPLRLGALPLNTVRLPNHRHPPRSVSLSEIIDDRQAATDFAAS